MKKVLRFIRNLLLILIVLTGIAGGLLFRRGYVRYREAVEDTPVAESAGTYLSCGNCLAFEEIDPDFVNAVVSAEDKRFFTRSGFDWIALTRALISNLKAGKAVEGGSTISQQIAKNLYFISVPRELDEKLAEVFIMSDLEKQYTKESLFAIYSNMNYYGDGFWGLKQAAAGYYGTEASELTAAQAAMLAGIPNAPAIYQLSTGHDLALQRQRRILSAMRKNNYISEEEYRDALNEDV